jgi:hypothetical protein
MSAPMEMFDYNKIIAISDFPNFINVYKALGENATIHINEKEIGDNEYEPFSITLASEATNVEYALSNPTSIKSGRSPLPPEEEDNTFRFTINENELRNIKVLTSALVCDTAEHGTALAIKKEKNSDIVSLKFKGAAAFGNSFDKTYTVTGAEDKEIKLMFDPMFFTWLPNNDYTIRIANYENGGTPNIMATGTIMSSEGEGETYKEFEVATHNFIAGRLNTAYSE